MTQRGSSMHRIVKMQEIHSSTKLLMTCAAVGFISILALNIILLVRLLPNQDRYETALGDFSSPTILNRVPGVPGPAAKLAEIVVIQQERCVNRNTKLVVQTIWTSSDSSISASNEEKLKSNLMKGCATTTLALQMPEKVTPGSWFIQGIVRDDISGDVRYWSSEIFVVVS